MGRWFAFRYSLLRFLLAVVFVSVFLGLNLRRVGPVKPCGFSYGKAYYLGWPFPVYVESIGAGPWMEPSDLVSARPMPSDNRTVEEYLEDVLTNRDREPLRMFPYTHITYHLIDRRPIRWLSSPANRLWLCRAIDLVVLVGGLALILFLRWSAKPSFPIRANEESR